MGSNHAHRRVTDNFKIGAFTIVPDQHKVVGPVQTVEIEPRLMRLLLILVEHQGQVLSRNTLLDQVWPDVIVQEDSLTKAISQLRKHLNSDNDELIKTIRKSGYLLAATVTFEDTTSSTGSETSRTFNSKVLAFFLLLAIGLVAVLMLQSDKTPPPDSFAVTRVQRLTSAPGSEIDAAISPDGQHLAYVQVNDEHFFNIQLLKLSDNHLQTLEASRYRDRFPKWDHNNDRIAFIRYAADQAKLMIYEPIHKQQKELLSLPFIGQGLAWDTDNETLYFSAKNNASDNFKLYQVNITSGALRQLTNPPASYEGDQDVVVHTATQRTGFLRHNRQGIMSFMEYKSDSGATVLFTQQSASFSFDWFRNGIVYDKFQDGQYGLTFYDLNHQRHIPIRLPGQWNILAQGHNNNLLYLDFHLRRDVYLYDLKEQTTRPFIQSTQLDFDAYFNHQNHQVAFISSASGSMQLHLADTSGKVTRQLTQYNNAFLNTPKWSPDDKKIALQVNKDGVNHIDIIEVDSGDRYAISFIGADKSMQVKPEWSASGDSLYFGSDVSGNWQIHCYNLNNKQVEQITLNGARIAKVNSNANLLYFTKQNQPGLWVFDIPDKREHQLIENLALQDLNNWVVTEERIYFISRTEAEPRISQLDLISNDVRTLGKIEAPENVSLSHAKQLNALLYTKEISRKSDVMLAKFE